MGVKKKVGGGGAGTPRSGGTATGSSAAGGGDVAEGKTNNPKKGMKHSSSTDSLSLWMATTGAGGGGGGGGGAKPGIASSASLDFMEEKDIDDHPFTVGHHLLVRYRDGSERLSKIIEFREQAGGDSWKYYIHYLDFNRRMDEWIDPSRVIKLPSAANIMASSSSSAVNLGGGGSSSGGGNHNGLVSRNSRSDVGWDSSQDLSMRIGRSPYRGGNSNSSNGINNSSSGYGDDFDDAANELDGFINGDFGDDVGGGGGLYLEDGDESSQFGGRRMKSRVDKAGDSYLSASDSMMFESNFNSNRSGSSSSNHGVTTIAELEHDEHEGMDAASLLEHEEITKVKNINFVQLGKYVMECWYFSPYPSEIYAKQNPLEVLYVCEFTFRFFTSKEDLLWFHNKTRPYLNRHPPGNEIYRDSKIAFFEVDGAVEKMYCQNLATFAKLFLDHKTLYWDVDPFLFYVLCTYDDRGYHPVGFFSKEKFSDAGYNLACILTFPSSQRLGFGKILIAFSYELSKKEFKAGSPEKPLSDLGAISYKSYWISTLLPIIQSFHGNTITLMELSRQTSILSDDIITALQSIGLIQEFQQAGGTTQFMIYAPPDLMSELITKYKPNGHRLDPDRLHWTPLYVTEPKKDKWSLKAKVMLGVNKEVERIQVTGALAGRSTPSLMSEQTSNTTIISSITSSSTNYDNSTTAGGGGSISVV